MSEFNQQVQQVLDDHKKRVNEMKEDINQQHELRLKAFNNCVKTGKLSELSEASKNNDWETIRKLGEE